MIAEILKPGAANGQTMEQLKDLFDCDAREIRCQVHRERIRGAVILAGRSGYYLPSEDPEAALHEIRAFERQMKAKARNTLEATKSATAARRELESNEQRANKEKSNSERTPRNGGRVCNVPF